MSQSQLRDAALDLWRAGVNAVDSATLTARALSEWRGGLLVGGIPWIPRPQSRICVVGAGKAGTGMVRGVLTGLGELWRTRLSGWVNVPDDCVPDPDETTHLPITIHGARPASLNEPTPAGVHGTQQILQLVSALQPDDLCLVLISGGGSALLPAPIPGISLADKQLVTRTLSRGGADIHQLNTVRRALSQMKGGGLLRACRAGLLVSLIISDVAGDPLPTIASGPTVDLPPDKIAAWKLVQQFFKAMNEPIPESVTAALSRQQSLDDARRSPITCRFRNLVIGNNRTAVEAAASEARRKGWTVVSTEWDQAGEAAEVGKEFVTRLRELKARAAAGTSPASPANSRLCFISGGEPTVHITPHSGQQQGGRNQELILSALCELQNEPLPGAALVSGGTDGEDGPTDAAGAWVDSAAVEAVSRENLNPHDWLRVHNSYPFLEQQGLLLKTGPTHTNVMDLRVGVVDASTTHGERGASA